MQGKGKGKGKLVNTEDPEMGVGGIWTWKSPPRPLYEDAGIVANSAT